MHRHPWDPYRDSWGTHVNPVDVGDPEGGWEDDEDMFEAPWEEETWDDSGA